MNAVPANRFEDSLRPDPTAEIVDTRRARPLLVEAERLLRLNLVGISEYLDDPQVTEIMINSPESIFIESYGGIRKIDDLSISEQQIESSLHALMRLNSKEISNVMDARLPGLRIAAALPPVSIHGPMLVIRRHSSRRFKLDEYVENGSFDKLDAASIRNDESTSSRRDEMEATASKGGDGLAAFLKWAVRTKKNILVVGGTSSGKTTLLSSLLLEIPDTDRIISCEDPHEIVLEQPNIVQFEVTRSDSEESVTIRDLVRLCLRSRPDRIIIGELRGEEAYDFLDAMNTGHSGSVCTLHANSSMGGLRRMESLVRMSPTAANLPLASMRAEIATAIDYVLYQSKAGGVRAPQQVLGIAGLKGDDYDTRMIFSRTGAT